MAMTMSSAMPVAAGSHRRREQTALPSAIHARRRRAGAASNGANYAENEDAEEEETKKEMASSRRVGSVRFAHYDSELEDSDQTITGYGRPPRARSRFAQPQYQQMNMATLTRSKSSFFPDSTDDEDIAARGREQLSQSITSRPPVQSVAAAAVPTFPVIHIGDVQFPMTRTVLWDRRVLAEPFMLRTVDVLPRICIRNNVLKQLHALLVQDAKKTSSKSSTSPPRLLAYACGSPPPDGVDAGVILSQLDHQNPDQSAYQWSVPCYRHQSEDRARARRTLIDATQATFESSSSNRPKTKISTLPLHGHAVVSLSADRSRAEIDVELECAVPQAEFQLSLIRSLPVLMTPLSASLLRCEFGAESLRSGFLTLDRARKAVPLLETDPLVLQRPMVGVWVYGVAAGSSSSESVAVTDPYLLQACIRYLVSRVIKERAQVEAGSFLVAVYPGRQADPLPRYFECQVLGGGSSRGAPVQWTTATARNRCLAGVSSFSNDLELTLNLSEEPVETKAKFDTETKPPPPISTSTRVMSAMGASASSSMAPVYRPQASVPPTPASQPCCESHELLVRQHQELFDQQQRQLSEMQRQISELQLVLSETRAENARLLAAASSAGSAASENGSDSQRTRSDPPQPAINHDQQEDDERSEPDADNDASQLSSLALSSISHASSNASDLSSLSSSLVGSRLKTMLTTDDHDEATAEDHAESPVEDDDATVADVCPYTPASTRAAQRSRSKRAQCERDEFEDEEDSRKLDELLIERLRIPSTPNRDEIVRAGDLATLGFSHGSSFSIPKIKFVPTMDSDEDDEEEIRQIELKYRSRRR